MITIIIAVNAIVMCCYDKVLDTSSLFCRQDVSQQDQGLAGLRTGRLRPSCVSLGNETVSLKQLRVVVIVF